MRKNVNRKTNKEKVQDDLLRSYKMYRNWYFKTCLTLKNSSYFMWATFLQLNIQPKIYNIFQIR